MSRGPRLAALQVPPSPGGTGTQEPAVSRPLHAHQAGVNSVLFITVSHNSPPKKACEQSLYLCVLCRVLSHFSHVRLFATPGTVARQAPLSMGILQARILE